MGQFIVKIDEYFLEWSSVVDAPVTFGMSLDEFKKYYLAEYGDAGYEKLDSRLQRVEENGTSARGVDNVTDLIGFNRAGPNESSLSFDEIKTAYCLREPIKNGWLVPVYNT